MSIVLLGIESPTPRNDTDRLNALLLTRGRRDNFCPRRHSREDEPDEPQAVECRCACRCTTRIWEIDSTAASISFRQDATVRLSMAAKIEECFGKQQARRELPVPLHRGFDVSAERRSRVSNVCPR